MEFAFLKHFGLEDILILHAGCCSAEVVVSVAFEPGLILLKSLTYT